MNKMNLISERNYRQWPSWHIIYEWEDVFSDCGFNLIIRKNSLFDKVYRKLNRIIRNKINPVFKTNEKEYKFRWILNARGYKEYTEMNTIPIFLDFPIDMVNEINRTTKELPFYWVTCLDIYEELKKMGSSNVMFMPLSISDKYFTKVVPRKQIDVIQFGRKNIVLHEYMLEYCKKKPNTEYVYQTSDGSLTYVSTIRGNLGKFDTRQSYFQLLSACRVSLVSSPGKDGSRDFGGIDFITPRFFESAVNYCYMAGRYTDNNEAQLVGINKLCPCVENYEQFESIMENYLSKSEFEEKEIYDNFLKKNITSVRVQEVLKTVVDNKLDEN